MTVPYDGLNSEHNPLFRLSDMIYIKNLTNPNFENSISPDSSTNQISQSGQITVDSTYTTYVFSGYGYRQEQFWQNFIGQDQNMFQ